MDQKPLKLAATIGVVVVALIGLAFGIRSASKADDYTPSPGGKVNFVMPPPKNTGVNPAMGTGSVPRMGPTDSRDTTPPMPMSRP